MDAPTSETVLDERDGDLEDYRPLLGPATERAGVPSSKNAAVKRAVCDLLQSSKRSEVEEGLVFMRRFLTVLVLHYTTILLVAFIFLVSEGMQEISHTHRLPLDLVALLGVIVSVCVAFTRGSTYPWTHVAIVGLTLSLAIDIGLVCSEMPFGSHGLAAFVPLPISLGIICSSIDPSYEQQSSLVWLTFPRTTATCFGVGCGLATLLFATMGTSLTVAAGSGLCGCFIASLILRGCQFIATRVGPEEYILAALFILVPETIPFLAVRNNPHANKTDEEPE